MLFEDEGEPTYLQEDTPNLPNTSLDEPLESEKLDEYGTLISDSLPCLYIINPRTVPHQCRRAARKTSGVNK